MNVAVAMTVLAGVALLWIWAPAYPEPERDPHMRAMDTLARAVRLHDCPVGHDDDCPLEYPHGRCACGGAFDERGVCESRCARESWDIR